MSTDSHFVRKEHAVKIIRQAVPLQPPQPVTPTHHGIFQRLSQGIATKAGAPGAFILAISAVVIWAATGPLLHFSEGWQLTINTGTTIVTFLMVFAIQNTQNRDSKALHLKLDELIKKTHGASAEFVDIEDLDDSELDGLHTQFKDLHDKFMARSTKP
jgi:low affinity Fe/Cu permease